MKCWQCPIDCRFVCNWEMCAERQMRTQRHTHTQSIISLLLLSSWCFSLFLHFSFLVSFCFAFDHNDSRQFISSLKRILLVVAGGNRLAVFASVCFFFSSLFIGHFRGFWMLEQRAWVRARPQNTEQYVNLISFRWIRVVLCFFFFSHWFGLGLASLVDCCSTTKYHQCDYSKWSSCSWGCSRSIKRRECFARIFIYTYLFVLHFQLHPNLNDSTMTGRCGNYFMWERMKKWIRECGRDGRVEDELIWLLDAVFLVVFSFLSLLL